MTFCNGYSALLAEWNAQEHAEAIMREKQRLAEEKKAKCMGVLREFLWQELPGILRNTALSRICEGAERWCPNSTNSQTCRHHNNQQRQRPTTQNLILLTSFIPFP